jgi:sulfur-oxidizing protein SoxY
MTGLTRRRFLLAGTATAGAVLLPAGWAPTRATEAEVAALIKDLAGEGGVKPGRVKLDLPLLVENGNTVSMTVTAEGPPAGPQRVQSIHVFAERNPLPVGPGTDLDPHPSRDVADGDRRRQAGGRKLLERQHRAARHPRGLPGVRRWRAR